MPPTEDLDLHVPGSKTRCPWCHEEVTADEPDWLACVACLARHHGECWREHSACATCGSDRHLVQPGAGRHELWTGELPPADESWARLAISLCVAFVLLVGGGAAIGAFIGGPLGAVIGALIGLVILVQLGGVIVG